MDCTYSVTCWSNIPVRLKTSVLSMPVNYKPLRHLNRLVLTVIPSREHRSWQWQN